MCVCVCVRERETERERHTHTHRQDCDGPTIREKHRAWKTSEMRSDTEQRLGAGNTRAFDHDFW